MGQTGLQCKNVGAARIRTHLDTKLDIFTICYLDIALQIMCADR